jgi:hypothetical protein
MKNNQLLNPIDNNMEINEATNSLLDRFDLYVAEEKNCFDELTLIITIFHSVWCHSNASHFQFFIK